MSKRTSTIIDILWLLSIASAVMSFASWLSGNEHAQLYSAIWACFCVQQAVLLCVYPRKGQHS